MDPITGTGLILALIPLYQKEREKQAQKKKEEAQLNKDDFFQWLVDHNFKEVKDCITVNFELATQIESLLHSNHDELMERFNQLEDMIGMVASGFDEFRNIAIAINPAVELSEQALSILKQFVESGGGSMMTIKHLQGVLLRTNNGCNITFNEPKYLEDDLATLCNLRLISFNGHLPKGAGETYRINRLAEKFISKLNSYDR